MSTKTITLGVVTNGYPKVEFINSLLPVLLSGALSNVMIVPRLPRHQARTRIATAAQTSHILFVDDDMVFDARDVKALVDADKDIVSGLYLKPEGGEPQPVVFDFTDGKFNWALPKPELSKVGATGLSFCLINKMVFMKTGSEFKYTEKYNDEMEFMQRARLYGFDVWLEPKARVGKVTEIVI